MIPSGFSDHSLVLCDVFMSKIKPKSAYWHFNTAPLSDENFKGVFNFWGDNLKKNEKIYFDSLRQWWDSGKVQIKELCQQYTQNVTKDMARLITTWRLE